MIDSLSYIGFTSPAADEWRTFGTEVLGLQLVEPRSTEDRTVRLRADDAVQRLMIEPGEANNLAYLGWAVSGPEEFAIIVSNVTSAGFTVNQGDAALIAERQVADVAWFTDAFGFRHELSWGLLTRPSTFHPSRSMSGFVTGEGGLGHAVLIVPDINAATAFYTDVLGFTLSDQVHVGVTIRFFHCNSRHHTIALVGVPGMVGVHHLMLEVKSIDDVGIAHDMCIERNIPLAMTLGRHTNDFMTSFYVRTPSGFELEYGWGAITVDMSVPWTAQSFDSTSVWGHKPPSEPLFPGILKPFVAANS